jgi:hypothetical protein
MGDIRQFKWEVNGKLLPNKIASTWESYNKLIKKKGYIGSKKGFKAK